MSTPKSHLAPGLSHRHSVVVTDRHTVPNVSPERPGFADMPPVFATAMMIGFIEQTCITALRPYLTGDQRMVGTHVDVSRTAATPTGMQVVAEVVLTAVAGRTLQFDVACYDAAGLIGLGTHRRAIVDHTTFLQRVAARSEQPIWSLI